MFMETLSQNQSNITIREGRSTFFKTSQTDLVKHKHPHEDHHFQKNAIFALSLNQPQKQERYERNWKYDHP